MAKKPKLVPDRRRGTKPRHVRLPGTEDAAIEDIEAAALIYEDARDERMAATGPEVEAKAALIAAMHRHRKSHYERTLNDGTKLVISLTVEKESVRVRRRKAKLEDVEGAA